MKNLKNLEYMSEVAKKDTKPIANVQYLNKKIVYHSHGAMCLKLYFLMDSSKHEGRVVKRTYINFEN